MFETCGASMKLVGLMLCRNSDWIIGFSVRAALLWCDAVVVLMHNCTDETWPVVRKRMDGEYANVVWPMWDDSPEWEEMRLRQAMLVAARGLGATHIAMIDDDEILTGPLQPDRVRKLIEGASIGQVLQLPWLQLSGGIDKVMVSGMWQRGRVSMAFKDFPTYHWKAQDGYDFHHRHPMGDQLQYACPIEDQSNGLMHLQFCSRRRLLAKQYLYQLTEMKRWPGRKQPYEISAFYSRSVTESEDAMLAPVPVSWWAPYAHLMQYLNLDAEPWQEKECIRLLKENPELGDGLNDFGLRENWRI